MIPLNFAADPTFWIEDDVTRWSLYLVRAVDLRARLFSADALIEDSYDPYLTVRESYLQHQRFLLFDGEPPEEDDFYDDDDATVTVSTAQVRLGVTARVDVLGVGLAAAELPVVIEGAGASARLAAITCGGSTCGPTPAAATSPSS